MRKPSRSSSIIHNRRDLTAVGTLGSQREATVLFLVRLRDGEYDGAVVIVEIGVAEDVAIFGELPAGVNGGSDPSKFDGRRAE
jgi:hypothetical protein